MSDLPIRLRMCADGDIREHARDSLIGIHPESEELREWAVLMEAAADEIDRLIRERDGAMEEANAADARVVAIACENAQLRAALEWYGEQARLCRLIHSEGDAGRQALDADGGNRARAALKAAEETSA